MIELAIITHMPMSEWVAWGERAVKTGFDVLRVLHGEPGDDNRQMSG